MDGWMDGWIDGWMDGLMNERRDEPAESVEENGGRERPRGADDEDASGVVLAGDWKKRRAAWQFQKGRKTDISGAATRRAESGKAQRAPAILRESMDSIAFGYP
jgi:hypothetical protein